MSGSSSNHGEVRLRGPDLLARISNEMVRAQKRYFGKGPTKAKSYIMDDLLFIVMRGGLTAAEHTMVEFDQEEKVRDFRQAFEHEMSERLTGMVEDLTGRKVLAHQSQILFDPDMVIQMFVFDDDATKGAREATAEAQLQEDTTGEATDEEALDPPDTSG